MKHKKIAFIGMMGSGKSTVANLLSKKIHIKLFDMDMMFEEQNNISISDFFKKFSQEEFRTLETALLKKISNESEFILSTGGGTVLREENRNILFNSDIYTIFLDADVENIYKRIKHDNSRPLLQVDNPKEEIEKILNQRIEFYNKANLKINTNNKTTLEIIKEIEWIL